ncbi:hypothetical protein AK812_SmicGene6959 [Symbiodinium microadriaticum]|uniref:Uncharacterized protein n=1 Tax=Symbiodinium microadriaticum TaxID=2951 RepID=A0A1Q9EPR3_SYMMI|nr:hypothetical protein AK812_SmicGene6959 [Symbiodinium microadriaticum]
MNILSGMLFFVLRAISDGRSSLRERARGFNVVRLTWDAAWDIMSNHQVNTVLTNPTVTSRRVAANPQLLGKRALDVMDAVIEAPPLAEILEVGLGRRFQSPNIATAMDSPRSPRPQEAQVEPPEEAPPRALSGPSQYRVQSDSTLEDLQKQLQEQAMAGGSLDSQRLDRIMPDPCPPRGPSGAVQKTGAQSFPLDDFVGVQRRPCVRTLHSAVDKAVLERSVSGAESKDEVAHGFDRCCQACIDRLCIILLLPIGVVLHGQPRWVASVRAAAVLMGMVLWAACLSTAITGGNTGWQMGSCLLHVAEATANLILLLQKSCSISFQEFNAHVKDAMRSQNMGPAQKSAVKWHILVITASLACWMICQVAKVRLVAMGAGQMTWEVVALPCLQCLYRAGWVLWLLRLNEFVNELVDAFCRSCASNPEGVDLAYIHWARISAFTGQITEHCQTVYGVMSVTALMGGVAPIAEIFMPTSSPQSTDWMLPQPAASIVVICLTTYAWGSTAMVSHKSKKAACFVNSLQGCLPGDARAEIRWLVGYMASSDSGIFFGGSQVDLRWYSRLRYVTFSASVFLAVRFQALPEAHKALLAEQWGRFLHALAVWESASGD